MRENPKKPVIPLEDQMPCSALDKELLTRRQMDLESLIAPSILLVVGVGLLITGLSVVFEQVDPNRAIKDRNERLVVDAIKNETIARELNAGVRP